MQEQSIRHEQVLQEAPGLYRGAKGSRLLGLWVPDPSRCPVPAGFKPWFTVLAACRVQSPLASPSPEEERFPSEACREICRQAPLEAEVPSENRLDQRAKRHRVPTSKLQQGSKSLLERGVGKAHA